MKTTPARRRDQRTRSMTSSLDFVCSVEALAPVRPRCGGHDLVADYRQSRPSGQSRATIASRESARVALYNPTRFPPIDGTELPTAHMVSATREVGMSATPTMRVTAFAVGIALILAAWPIQVSAQQLRVGPSDIGGVGDQRQRTGGRRVGHCRNDRAGHEAVRQDRGHRRSRSLPAARSPLGRAIQRLGPRVRSRRFAARCREAGHDAQPHCHGRAHGAGGGPGTIRALTGGRCSRFPRSRCSRARGPRATA